MISKLCYFNILINIKKYFKHFIKIIYYKTALFVTEIAV